MTVLKIVKKHKSNIFRLLMAAVLCGIVAVFAYTFDTGLLPFTSDGEEFHTIYAAEEPV